MSGAPPLPISDVDGHPHPMNPTRHPATMLKPPKTPPPQTGEVRVSLSTHPSSPVRCAMPPVNVSRYVEMRTRLPRSEVVFAGFVGSTDSLVYRHLALGPETHCFSVEARLSTNQQEPILGTARLLHTVGSDR